MLKQNLKNTSQRSNVAEGAITVKCLFQHQMQEPNDTAASIARCVFRSWSVICEQFTKMKRM